MIRLPDLHLDSHHALELAVWQAEIDNMTAYADRVQAGKDRFSARNKIGNPTFDHIKDVLVKMCQGHRRCGYCEDSFADEVEHIWPKDLYPEAVFLWSNYLYACGPCNGPKNNKYAVLIGNPPVRTDVTRGRHAAVVPPLFGQPALINPRTEDPLHFLFLDLLNTFVFSVRDASGVSDTDKIRAAYTMEVLHLNSRDALVQARKTAFGTYRARLGEYIGEKNAGASQADLDRHRDELLKVGHQTVWREMQRQQANYPVLQNLFTAAPEALAW